MQEIELKFLVPDYKIDALMRQTKIKSSTTSQLAAHYFDTSENALANSGMALRIRQEGEAWVQTLKSSGDGIASRGEQNNILDSVQTAQAVETDTLYPDLSLYEGVEIEQVLINSLIPDESESKDTANRPLVRQYVTDVERTTRLIKKDNNIIEVAYDEGVVIHGENDKVQQPIHEIEFELVKGDVSFLFETAKTWCKRYKLCMSTVTKAERGGLLLQNKQFADAKKSDLKKLTVNESMSQPQFMRAVVHNCMIQLLPNASAIAAGSTDGNHVHQLRVAIRRLRTALKFFAGFSKEVNPEWLPILKQTFSLLGEYRDRELLQERTQPMLEALGGPYVNWTTERNSIRVMPIDAVQANDFQLTLLELVEYTMSSAKKDKGLNKEKAKPAVSRILDKLYNKIAKASDNFASLDIESQHDVRKRLKSLRYVSEFTSPMFKKQKTKSFLKYLEPVQEVLGDYNDDLVGHEFYQTKAHLDPNAWFAVGYFSAEQQHAAKQCAESLKVIRQAPVFW